MVIHPLVGLVRLNIILADDERTAQMEVWGKHARVNPSCVSVRVQFPEWRRRDEPELEEFLAALDDLDGEGGEHRLPWLAAAIESAWGYAIARARAERERMSLPPLRPPF